MRPEPHQLVNPLSVNLVELAAASSISQGDSFTGAVGKVDDGLVIGDEGEGKHFYLGVKEGGLSPMYLR